MLSTPLNVIVSGLGLQGGEVGCWHHVKMRIVNEEKVVVTPPPSLLFSNDRPRIRVRLRRRRQHESVVVTIQAAAGQSNRLFDHQIIDCDIHWEVTEFPNGLYHIIYNYSKPGMYLLELTLDGLHIQGSPFSVHLITSTPCPAATRLSGPNLFHCFASPSTTSTTHYYLLDDDIIPLYQNKFTLTLHDDQGNRVPLGGHNLTAHGTKGAIVTAILDQGDGTYQVRYQVTVDRHAIQATTLDLLEKAQQLGRRTTRDNDDNNDDDNDDIILGGGEDVEKRRLEMQLKMGFQVQLEVKLYQHHVFGSPFKIYIQNLIHIRHLLDLQDLYSQTGQMCQAIKTDVHNGLYGTAINKFNLLLAAIHKGRTTTGQDDDNNHNHHHNPTEHKGNVQILQNEWLHLCSLRSAVETATETATADSTLLRGFTEYLRDVFEHLTRDKIETLAFEFDVNHRMARIRPLQNELHQEYDQMFNNKTKALKKYVEWLNTEEFPSLEHTLRMYQLIAEELRNLHRYKMADVFDLLVERALDEIDITKVTTLLVDKETKCDKRENLLLVKEDAVKLLKERVTSHTKENPVPDKKETNRLLLLQKHKRVQTEDVMSERFGLFTSLIAQRMSDQQPKRSTISQIVKKNWCNCHPVDIHTTFRKLLSSCPRLRSALEQLFVFYSGVSSKRLSDDDDGTHAGGTIGLSWTVYVRLCTDLRLHPDLLKDTEWLRWLFEKFSVCPRSFQVSPSGFYRLLPYHMWLSFLRELAYLNTLFELIGDQLKTLPSSSPAVPDHPIIIHQLDNKTAGKVDAGSGKENAASVSSDALEDIVTQPHPSRLSSFHYFAKYHLVPLYYHFHKIYR